MKHPHALVTVFLAVLIDLLGFGIVLPLLPFYASMFEASAITIGLLYSVYSFAQLVFSPIWGSISDQVGRRPIMLISTFGAALAYGLFAFSHTLFLLFLSRILAGIMGGNIATAQAYMADITGAKDRAKGMGLIGAAFGIGFALGPAISSALIHPALLSALHVPENERFILPGLAAAFFSLISFLLVLFKLPETVEKKAWPASGRFPLFDRSVFSRSFWETIFSDAHQSGSLRIFPMLVGCAFLVSLTQASLYSAFPLFSSHHLHLSAEKVGALFGCMGFIAIVIQGGLINRLVRLFGETRLFLSGSVLMLTGFALIPFSESIQMLTIYLCVMSVGGSLSGPTLNSLISKEARAEKIGTALGTSQGMASLGRVLGPTWGGYLYDKNYRLPFLATAAVLSFTVMAGLKLRKFKSVLDRK